MVNFKKKNKEVLHEREEKEKKDKTESYLMLENEKKSLEPDLNQ